MKKKFIAILCIILFLVCGCVKSMSDIVMPRVDRNDILNAQELFEEEVERLSLHATKSEEELTRPDILFNLGCLAPDWQNAEVSVNILSKLHFVETHLTTTFRFRVLQRSVDAKKPRKVKVYHELLVLNEQTKAGRGVYVVFYIASNKYIKWHKGILNDRFNNSGDMRNYSGLKVYTDLRGRIVRVNKYVDGHKMTGIYLPKYKTVDEQRMRDAFLSELFKDVSFQYGVRIAPPTKGFEDDNDWSWLDASYCYADYGDDDYDDSEDYYDPDDNNGYQDWDNDYSILYGGGNDETPDDDGEDEKTGAFGNKHESKHLQINEAKSAYNGYSKQRKVDCMEAAKSVMRALGVTSFTGKDQMNYRIQTLNMSGAQKDNLLPAIQYIVTKLDDNTPVLVGMDYATGTKSNDMDGVTDHYVVIIGYWVTSETTIEFSFVECALGKADDAFNEVHTMMYHVGDTSVVGIHWLANYAGDYLMSHVRKNNKSK